MSSLSLLSFTRVCFNFMSIATTCSISIIQCTFGSLLTRAHTYCTCLHSGAYPRHFNMVVILKKCPTKSKQTKYFCNCILHIKKKRSLLNQPFSKKVGGVALPTPPTAPTRYAPVCPVQVNRLNRANLHPLAPLHHRLFHVLSGCYIYHPLALDYTFFPMALDYIYHPQLLV